MLLLAAVVESGLMESVSRKHPESDGPPQLKCIACRQAAQAKGQKSAPRAFIREEDYELMVRLTRSTSSLLRLATRPTT